MIARTCTRCQAPHYRYAHLCAMCDPTFAPALSVCVWPLRCYCDTHVGRPPHHVTAAAPRRYGYDLTRYLAGKVDA